MKKGEEKVKTKEKDEENQMLAGLKRYHDKGIPIVIDGMDSEENDWNKIFEVREDDSFYMADFVPDEDTGCLREIRFDRVYYN